jgi:hypothetical protein
MITRMVCCLYIVFSLFVLHAESEFMIISEAGSSAGSVRLANVQGFSSLSNSVFENPAALYRVYLGSAALFHTTFMEEVGVNNGSVAFRLRSGVLGIGYMGSTIDGIYSTNVDTAAEIYSTGTFSEKREVIKVSYAVSQSDSLHIGFSGSYYSMTMDTVKGTGINVDFGAIIDLDVLDLSFTAKNILSSMKVDYKDTASLSDSFLDASGNIREEVDALFGKQLSEAKYTSDDTWLVSSDSISETLPLQIIYGARYTAGPFDIYGQLKSSGTNRGFVKNASVNYSPSLLSFLSLSGGIKQSVVNESVQGGAEEVVITSQVMGVGLDLMGVTFDYAYETNEVHPEFQNMHYFSLGLSF